ncbi:MAG: sugar transferase [Paracoccaceae bacterium]
MSRRDRILKRGLDVALSALLLALTAPVVAAAAVAARLDTGASGLFRQPRVGRNGRIFRVVKIRTMRRENGATVTVRGDARITRLGGWLRRWKIDELPQLWNVLCGDMSLVGPRPDMPGFLDGLEGEDRVLLRLRPGITGPATLKYRDEEDLLAGNSDPERYNRQVIWPDKVRLNREYLNNYSLRGDLRCLWRTVAGG